MIRAACLGLILLASGAASATAAEIVIHDDKSSPESLTVAPAGDLVWLTERGTGKVRSIPAPK